MTNNIKYSLCSECIHHDVCSIDSPKEYAERFATQMYGKGPNDDYDWDYILEHSRVTVSFNCKHFRREAGVLISAR